MVPARRRVARRASLQRVRTKTCVSGALRLRRALATGPRTHACARALQRSSACQRIMGIDVAASVSFAKTMPLGERCTQQLIFSNLTRPRAVYSRQVHVKAESIFLIKHLERHTSKIEGEREVKYNSVGGVELSLIHI